MGNWDPIDLTVTLTMIIAASTAYIAGRVHEWSRQHPDRRFAYCQGYDRASSAMLAMAPTDAANADVPPAPHLAPPM